jgi:peptidoglycan-associated lipoprotein
MADTRQSTSETWGDRLRYAVILTAVVATLATVAGSVFWLQDGSGAASAGAAATKPTTPPAPRATAPAPTPPEADVVHVDIYFDFKSTRLRADAVTQLQKQAGLVKPGETWAVLVQGHADSRGPAEYNRQLAQRRAQAVKQFLIELGVPETSVKVVTLGHEGTICDDPGRECQQLNRRVHLELRKLPRAAALLQPLRAQLAEADELDCPGDADDLDTTEGAAAPSAK